MKKDAASCLSLWIACTFLTVGPLADQARTALGVDGMIEELDRYYAAFDQPTALVLEYAHITTRPPLSYDEAARLADKWTRITTVAYFKGQRPEEEMTKLKRSPSCDEIVDRLQGGSCLQTTEVFTFSKRFARRTCLGLEGDIFDSIQQDGIITWYNNNLSLSPEKRLKTFEEGATADVKEETVLFEWRYHMFHEPEKHTYTYEEAGNGIQTLHASDKNGEYHLTLDARYEGPYLVPVKYTIRQELARATVTTQYWNHVVIAGVPVPSLILRRDIPDENAPAAARLSRPRSTYFVLQGGRSSS